MIAIANVLRALEHDGLLLGTRGSLPGEVALVTDDSRQAAPGALFLAVRGTERDGHAFVPAAEAAGAAVIVVDDAAVGAGPAIVVRDTRQAAAVVAAAAYGFPARALDIVGITGTNGKTTTAGLLRHLLDGAGDEAASIGTLGVLRGSEGEPVPGGGGLTTPGPVELQRILRALADAGVRTVAMEVSSHSLHQHRVDGIAFSAGVFTNLTRDHLDYHGTMEDYLEAKAGLVDRVREGGAIVVNADDRAWDRLATGRRTVRFGAALNAEVRFSDVTFSPRGSRFVLSAQGQQHEVALPLIGDFNVQNAVGAAAAAIACGLPAREAAVRLATSPQVPGRLEVVNEHPTVLRDYAHTPDALERALGAVRPFARGRLVVVFGCGGDRDRGKRPLMGGIAEKHADAVILTSDNPRTEDAQKILDDIESGMTHRRHLRIEDRRDAIAHAIANAGADDVVLLAGKGHEDYQIRGTEKLPFDEKLIVRELVGTA